MTTIAEFLTARWNEDEAIARAAIADDGGQDGGFEDNEWLTDGTILPGFGNAAAELIRTFAVPRRVLADIAAKRAILDAYSLTARLEDEAAERIRAAGDNPAAGDLNQWTRAHDEAAVLRQLAVLPLSAPHDQHPDYDQTWRPLCRSRSAPTPRHHANPMEPTTRTAGTAPTPTAAAPTPANSTS